MPIHCPAGPIEEEITPNSGRAFGKEQIDALVAVWLGIGIDELIAILRSRYPILTDREDKMWFDANGRKIAADPYAFGFGQTKEPHLLPAA